MLRAADKSIYEENSPLLKLSNGLFFCFLTGYLLYTQYAKNTS